MGVSLTQQQNFIQTYLPYAQGSSAQTGLPVQDILGLIAYETGWGTSAAATTENNAFGFSQNETPLSYPTLQQSFDAFGNFATANLGSISNANPTPSQFADALVQSGYNSANPQYSNQLSGTIQSVSNLLGSSGSGSASNPQGTSQTSGGFLATIGRWITSGAFVLLAIVVVAAGLFLLREEKSA